MKKWITILQKDWAAKITLWDYKTKKKLFSGWGNWWLAGAGIIIGSAFGYILRCYWQFPEIILF